MVKELDPTGRDAHQPGAKLDSGKVRAGLVLNGFSRALWEVSRVGTFGAVKYTPNGWRSVPNGIERYTDARDRHQLREAMGEELDPDSGLLHAAHAAWNALARLELLLRDRIPEPTNSVTRVIGDGKALVVPPSSDKESSTCQAGEGGEGGELAIRSANQGFPRPGGNVTLAELCERWQITRKAVVARAEALGVKLVKEKNPYNRGRPYIWAWPIERLEEGDRYQQTRYGQLRGSGHRPDCSPSEEGPPPGMTMQELRKRWNYVELGDRLHEHVQRYIHFKGFRIDDSE